MPRLKLEFSKNVVAELLTEEIQALHKIKGKTIIRGNCENNTKKTIEIEDIDATEAQIQKIITSHNFQACNLKRKGRRAKKKEVIFTNKDLVNGKLKHTHNFNNLRNRSMITNNLSERIKEDKITFLSVDEIEIDLTSQGVIFGQWILFLENNKKKG